MLIAGVLVGARVADMWSRLEDWILELQRDRVRLARYFVIAYWISLGVVLLGAVLILLSLTGWWAP